MPHSGTTGNLAGAVDHLPLTACLLITLSSGAHSLVDLVVKASASRVVEPGSIPAFAMDLLLGRVIPVTSLISDNNRKMSVMIETLLGVFGAGKCHSDLIAEV